MDFSSRQHPYDGSSWQSRSPETVCVHRNFKCAFLCVCMWVLVHVHTCVPMCVPVHVPLKTPKGTDHQAAEWPAGYLPRMNA